MASKALAVALATIENDDQGAFIAILNRLKLERLEEDDYYQIIALFLGSMMQYHRGSLARAFIEYLEEKDSLYRKGSAFVDLFLHNSISDEILRFLVATLTENTFADSVMELFLFDANDETRMACQRMIDIYNIDSSSAKILDQLRQEALKDGGETAESNWAVAEVLEENYRKLAPPVVKPAWVKNFPPYEGENTPTEEELIIPDVIPPLLPFPETLEGQVDLLVSGMKAYGMEVGTENEARARAEISKQLEALTPEQRLQLIAPVLANQGQQSLSNDEGLFRLFGPCNTIYGADLLRDRICDKYGGCRMLLCVCHETTDAEDDVIYDTDEVDWFTGSCEQCLKKIEHRHYALRLPLAHGSWRGCYCSFSCLRESLTSSDPTTRALIAKIEQSITSIGIQDRVENVNTTKPISTSAPATEEILSRFWSDL